MKLFSKIKDNPLLSFLIFLLVLAFGAFVGVLFFECIETYISKFLGLSNKNETLKFLGISMGGILIALQALMSYKRAKAMEDTAQAQADAAKAQASATEEQAKANQHTEQGQRQERFRNAIEHLGHEKDSVRMGGAYELCHLVQDTEELRQTVFDILCAHIRRTTGEYEYRERYKLKPSEEVQSLLTLLFVQRHEIFKGFQVDLQGTLLKGANLQKACLEKANLSRANLQEASLSGVHLQGAILSQAHLQGADLSEAYLQGAILSQAHLQGTDLRKAYLQGAYLGQANLQGASLFLTCLQGADLNEAHLQGARLTQPYLQEAILYKTDMRGTGCHGPLFLSFAQRVREAIDEKTDLSTVIFSGGLSQKNVDDLVKGLSGKKAEVLRRNLEYHIGQPQSNELPDHSAIIGSYTEEEAEQWIAEYEKAVSGVPADDS